jgi:CSLREA domain-containing protein
MTRRLISLLSIGLALVLLISLGTTPVVKAASVVGNVTVGDLPQGIAANSNTNKAYTADYTSNSVSVIDIGTSAVTNTIPVGTGPYGAAVNPNTNRLYITHPYNGLNYISVINTASNLFIRTINVGVDPTGIAVNTNTNRIYVANRNSYTVSVIDGSTNTVTGTIPVTCSNYVAVNTSTNRIYVTDNCNYWVWVIDGSTNTVINTIPVGANPTGIAANPNTNRIYVANHDSNSISIIDGTTNLVTATIALTSAPDFVEVNPTINRVYVSSYSAGTVAVIDGLNQIVISTLPVSGGPLMLAVNKSTAAVYATLPDTDNIVVIDDVVPTPLTVNTISDTNDGECVASCSLREAIALIAPGGTISFAPSVQGNMTLTNAFGELTITKDIIITGPGAPRVSISGGSIRVLNISAGTTLTVSGLTFAQGIHATIGGAIINAGTLNLDKAAIINSQAPRGAAIYNTGVLNVSNSTLSGNTATQFGGGVYNAGTATFNNVTIYGNIATGASTRGGGLYNASGTMLVTNATISGNTAGLNGAGVARGGGTIQLQNTIIASNTPGGNCSGGMTSGGNNVQYGDVSCIAGLAQKNPKLGPLQYSGGLTQTMALLTGSAAIDAGNNSLCSLKDQRGNPRPIDGDGNGSINCDAGAYEAPLIKPIAPTLLTPSGSITTSTPLFRWNPINGSSFYMVWLNDAAGNIIYQTQYPSGVVCATTPCSVLLDVYPGKLWNGNYTWWVKAYNAAGWGPWSTAKNFTVNEAPPPAPILKAPTTTVLTSWPDFTWTPSVRATAYVLSISNATGTVFQQTYDSWFYYWTNTGLCVGNQCKVLDPIQLWNGSYTFSVQAYGPGGFSTWNTQAFSVNEAPPAKAVLFNPAGVVTTFTPTFSWSVATRATSYILSITGPDGVVITQQYDSIYYCGGSCAVVPPNLDLLNGNYTWKIQSYGPGGYGPWSNTLSFTVDVPPPVAPILNYPVGTITNTNNPQYIWQEANNANYYYLWVDGPHGNVTSVMVYASDICSGGWCYYTPETLLSNATYTWQVQAQNPGGYGEWSSGASFTISIVGNAPRLTNGSTPVPTFVPR